MMSMRSSASLSKLGKINVTDAMMGPKWWRQFWCCSLFQRTEIRNKYFFCLLNVYPETPDGVTPKQVDMFDTLTHLRNN